MGAGRGKSRRFMAASIQPQPKNSPKSTNWHSQAKKAYKNGKSFRDISELLTTQGEKISRDDVSNYLHDEDDVIIRSPSKNYRVHKSIPQPGPEEVAARKLMIQGMRKRGESKEAIKMYEESEESRYQPVVFHCHNDDKVFNDPKFLDILSTCLREWQHATRNQVEGEGFEHFLVRALEEANYEVEMSTRGSLWDVKVKLQNQWVMFSYKSENRKDSQDKEGKGVFRTTSLAPHSENLDNPASCVRAINEAIEHLDAYERMLYLKASSGYFPEKEVGESGKSAQVYALLEGPRQELREKLAALKAKDFTDEFHKDKENKWVRNKPNTVNVPITDENGNKLCSVTLAKKEGRIKIYNINSSWCSLINKFWTEPVRGNRS